VAVEEAEMMSPRATSLRAKISVSISCVSREDRLGAVGFNGGRSA
jgi:hypothetical protein